MIQQHRGSLHPVPSPDPTQSQPAAWCGRPAGRHHAGNVITRRWLGHKHNMTPATAADAARRGAGEREGTQEREEVMSRA
ncbi:hypothetical protein E2C01_004053 [Portunus trituberculatus]|uniref:Uncharacterized protein n=1 Tax=Portunus trituberculatus TaxID=210409 RepID=A0A5B7CPI1_PORTR|nr:hypothetical protein [Portunus trituberculatus]